MTREQLKGHIQWSQKMLEDHIKWSEELFESHIEWVKEQAEKAGIFEEKGKDIQPEGDSGKEE